MAEINTSHGMEEGHLIPVPISHDYRHEQRLLISFVRFKRLRERVLLLTPRQGLRSVGKFGNLGNESRTSLPPCWQAHIIECGHGIEIAHNYPQPSMVKTTKTTPGERRAVPAIRRDRSLRATMRMIRKTSRSDH